MGFEMVRGRVGPRFSVLNDWQQVIPLATSLEAIFTSGGALDLEPPP